MVPQTSDSRKTPRTLHAACSCSQQRCHLSERGGTCGGIRVASERVFANVSGITTLVRKRVTKKVKQHMLILIPVSALGTALLALVCSFMLALTTHDFHVLTLYKFFVRKT